jgi:hypothetical protein
MMISRRHLVGVLLAVYAGSAPDWAQVEVKVEDSSRAKIGAGTKKTAEASTERRTLPRPIRAPVLGYLFNRDLGQLQAVRGLPGAASLSAPIDLGMTASLAVVSPRQDFALSVKADSGEVVVTNLEFGLPSSHSLSGALAGVEQIIFGPTGTSAALFNPAEHRLQVFHGLPYRPVESFQADLSNLPGAVTAIAVNDDAGVVVLGVAEGETGNLYAVTPERGSRLLMRSGEISSVSFVADSSDVLVADEGMNEVVLIRDVEAEGNRLFLAREGDGVAGPVAVAPSRDGRRAFVANAGSGTVLEVPLAGGSVSAFTCDCSIAGLQRLSGPETFLVSGRSDRPLVVFNGSSSHGRFTLIPPRASTMFHGPGATINKAAGDRQ